MILFSEIWPPQLGDDDTVIRHELGHALIWLAHGGVIERVCFHRTLDGFLGGRMKITPPDGHTEEQLRTNMPKQVTERALAGEIAAREYLGLSSIMMCSDLRVTPGSDLKQLLVGHENDPGDDTKALSLAHATAGPGWYEWLNERHAAARNVVLEHWERLDNASDIVHIDIPFRFGEEHFVSGSRIQKLLGF